MIVMKHVIKEIKNIGFILSISAQKYVEINNIMVLNSVMV